MRYLDSLKERLSALLPMWLVIMLVAIWSVVIQDGQINRDGLLYLMQAYLIKEVSWSQGLALYPWPFFSMLIAIFHKVTHLHLHAVAHGIDLVLFGVAAIFYLKILKLIYKQKHIIFYGGIILLSFIPIMDDYVGMVLRDHGLWAGCMVGTYFYFKNLKKYTLKTSFAWQFGFLISGLFRPEGLIFLLILPIWNFWHNKQNKLQQLVQDYGLLLILLILCFIGILFCGVDIFNILNSSRLIEFAHRPMQFLMQLTQPLPLSSSNVWLSKLLDNYSLLIAYTLLTSILIFKWLKGLGILHGGLLFYHIFKDESNHYQKHLYFLIITSFILVSVNLFNVYVLTNRYWGFHWWWVFILVTPVILNLLESRKTQHIIKYSLVFFILLLILNILFDQSDNIEQEVADYIRENQLTDVEYGDNYRIKYYVNYQVSDLINKSISQKYTYKVIKNLDKNNHEARFKIKNFPEQKTKFVLIKND